MSKEHLYTLNLTWTGNRGEGTAAYDKYDRSHTIQIAGKTMIEGSSDGIFRGDTSKHNPEDFFLASLAACHMLWYLHLCADHGIIVVRYDDRPQATLSINQQGIGKFTEVTLYPTIKIADLNLAQLAEELHHKANTYCFIANSCNFTVKHEVTIL